MLATIAIHPDISTYYTHVTSEMNFMTIRRDGSIIFSFNRRGNWGTKRLNHLLHTESMTKVHVGLMSSVPVMNRQALSYTC